MGSLAVLARVRLEALYHDAFGAPPQAGVLLPRKALVGAGDDGEERTPAVPGFRVAPIVMTDGLFEYDFRVIDVTEPVRGRDIVYVFARQRWPVLIGAAADAEAAAASIDAARLRAQRWSADELWVASLEGSSLDCQRVRLGLMQVYRPAANAG